MTDLVCFDNLLIPFKARRPLIFFISAMINEDQSQADPKRADLPPDGGDPTYLDQYPQPNTPEWWCIKLFDVPLVPQNSSSIMHKCRPSNSAGLVTV